MSPNKKNKPNPSISPEVAEARGTARYLQENFPGWKESLPDCPCTEAEIQADPQFSRSYFFVQTYHPGADTGYRSATSSLFTSSVNPDLTPLEPGQQCTFKEGQLITLGSGAGTPDAYRPAYGNYQEHREFDVQPSKALSLKEYQQTWTPNNGNKCPVNYAEQNLETIEMEPESSKRQENPRNNHSLGESRQTISNTDLDVDFEPNLEPNLDLGLSSSVDLDF